MCSATTALIFHTDPRQAKEIGELCRTYGCTIFLTTPTLLRFCLKRCEPDDFKTLRIFMVGAEKLARCIQLRTRVIDLFLEHAETVVARGRW